jgi:16S rRNA C1402 N4-methylase RsmH
MPEQTLQRRPLVQMAQELLAGRLGEGDIAIDATVGNGHDTVFLATQVGDTGRVYGFDIQQLALDSTWQRLDEAGLSSRVCLYHAGHETMALHLPEALRARVRVVMFNLGYLPGGDKRRTTTLATSLSALQQALAFLAPDGVLSVMAYTGHPGGREEAEAIKDWARGLPSPPWHHALHLPEGNNGKAPEWLLLMRG